MSDRPNGRPRPQYKKDPSKWTVTELLAAAEAAIKDRPSSDEDDDEDPFDAFERELRVFDRMIRPIGEECVYERREREAREAAEAAAAAKEKEDVEEAVEALVEAVVEAESPSTATVREPRSRMLARRRAAARLSKMTAPAAPSSPINLSDDEDELEVLWAAPTASRPPARPRPVANSAALSQRQALVRPQARIPPTAVAGVAPRRVVAAGGNMARDPPPHRVLAHRPAAPAAPHMVRRVLLANPIRRAGTTATASYTARPALLNRPPQLADYPYWSPPSASPNRPRPANGQQIHVQQARRVPDLVDNSPGVPRARVMPTGPPPDPLPRPAADWAGSSPIVSIDDPRRYLLSAPLPRPPHHM